MQRINHKHRCFPARYLGKTRSILESKKNPTAPQKAPPYCNRGGAGPALRSDLNHSP
jgi:hypothetical protein